MNRRKAGLAQEITQPIRRLVQSGQSWRCVLWRIWPRGPVRPDEILSSPEEGSRRRRTAARPARGAQGNARERARARGGGPGTSTGHLGEDGLLVLPHVACKLGLSRGGIVSKRNNSRYRALAGLDKKRSRGWSQRK